MVKAAFTFLASCTVVDALWKEFCEASPDVCSDYCINDPDACDKICEQAPSTKGCKQKCCDAEKAECLACKKGVPVDEFCETNKEVDGCCGSDCTKVHNGELIVEKKCKTRVKNQVAKVHRPVFLEMNIEKDCPVGDWFMHNIELCEQCSKLHMPCNNTHMACGGCCGTPWHSQLGLNINVEHTCADIKNIFLSQNSFTAECEVEEDSSESSDVDDSASAPHGEITFEDETPEEVWFEEMITAKCKSDIHQIVCRQSPLKVKFECDDCQNQGSPVLMNKCCDRCVEFAENLASNTKIPHFVKPIVWCSSCDDEYIYPEDREKFSAFPWPEHKKYSNYTEAKADERFISYIEDHICADMRSSCPAEEGEGRRLRGLSDDSSKGCLSVTNNCSTQSELYDDVAEGRRLLDQEEVAQINEGANVEVTDKKPKMFCDSLGDYYVDPSRLPKSVSTAEETVTATTMHQDPLQPTTTSGHGNLHGSNGSMNTTDGVIRLCTGLPLVIMALIMDAHR